MDLRLVEEDARNTTIILPDKSPLYSVETPFNLFSNLPTTIKKITGSQVSEMASLQIPGGLFGPDTYLTVWGRDITPVRGGVFSTSETFIAVDGKSYKWKSDLCLVANDGSHTVIAEYDPGSLGFFNSKNMRLPGLLVAPQGMHIGDDIVATFIYGLQAKQRRHRQRRRSRGDIGNEDETRDKM